MSRQELIDLLEQLRERYAERKKHLSALLKEIKTDHEEQRKVLSRRSRVKEGYVQYRLFYPDELPPEEALAPEPPPPVPPVDEATRTRMRSNERALANLVEALSVASKALQNEPLDVVKLAKGQELLAKIKPSLLPEQPAILESYSAILKAESERLGSTFGRILHDAFAAEGLKLEGKPPDMHIGRFRIKLDFLKRSARLFYGKEPVGKSVGLSAELILKEYHAAHREIYEREVDGKDWLKRLYEAWRIVRFRQGDKSSDANLVACYIEMVLRNQPDSFLRREPRKSLFKEYTRAQFAYDVDRFIFRQKLRHDGLTPFLRNASKAQTDSSDRAIWIVDGETPEGGSYMSTLTFRKEG